MPRFIKESDGRSIVIETAIATEAAELRRDGFKEEKARTAATRAADAVSATQVAASPEAAAAAAKSTK